MNENNIDINLQGKQPPASDSGEVSLREKIALRAYHLFEQRGCLNGHDLDDWLTAEREVLHQGAPSAEMLQ